MRLEIRQRWIELLGWIADRPRGSALTAGLLLIILSALIRAPIIDGSFVDQLAGANDRLEVARRIDAALGNRSTAAVILEPRDVPVGTVFADLAALRATLEAIDPAIEVRSIDEADAQLFAWGLDSGDPVGELLAALGQNPQSSQIISNDGRRFLVIVSSPRDGER